MEKAVELYLKIIKLNIFELNAPTRLNVSSTVEKLFMQKNAKKHFLLFFFATLTFFESQSRRRGEDNDTMPDVTSYSCLCDTLCVFICVCMSFFVCVCVCKRGIDTFCDKFWRFERNEYSRQSSDEGKWNVFKVKFFGLQFRRHIFFDLDIVWGRPLMTSRNFGQFLTPPLPIVLFKRPSFCRQKFLDPQPPKTSTSFMDHPFDKFWKSWEKALLSNWS